MALSPTPFSTPLAVSQSLDLSKLPAPDLVEVISYDAVLEEMRTLLITLWPEFSALVESDPGIKLLQVAAYRETILRQRINDAGRSVMLAFAGGADLDHLAGFYGVARLEISPANPATGAAAVMEGDDALRRRTLLAPDAMSTAGPEAAYVFHALSAVGTIRDASATSPAPRQVVVAIMSHNGDGTASPAEIAAVESALATNAHVRPLTDEVIIQAATAVDYEIELELTLFPGPDRDTILAASLAGVEAYKAQARALGRDVVREQITAAAQVSGVYKADLLSPAADIAVGATSFAQPTATSVIVAGYAT